MADLFDIAAKRPGPVVESTAFMRCEACSGFGFRRSSDFANRSFPRCLPCNGIGQVYLHPTPPPPPSD